MKLAKKDEKGIREEQTPSNQRKPVYFPSIFVSCIPMECKITYYLQCQDNKRTKKKKLEKRRQEKKENCEEKIGCWRKLYFAVL